MADKAQIPAKYLDSDGSDFAVPTSALLMALGLLGTKNADQPDGLNELQEGALKFSKWIGGLAGGAGIAGIATSVISAFTHAHEPTRVALISGGSVIAAAAVVAVALVVQADARARAKSTVAQYEARSKVSEAFLTLAAALLRPTAYQAADGSPDLLYAFAHLPANLRVQAKNHRKEMKVKGIRRTVGGELQVKLEDGDWVPEDEVEAFHLD